MGEHKVTSSYIPVNDADLVNKKYVDALTYLSSLDAKLDKTGGFLTGNIDLGVNKITSSYVAVNPHDIPNKEYVDSGLAQRLGDDDMKIIMNNLSLKLNKTDNRYVKNNVGYIPDLDLKFKSGFSVTTSSEIAAHGLAYHVFCSWKENWAVVTKVDMWLKVKCPEKVRIWKFALRGKGSNIDRISNWELKASNNDLDWETLYTADNILLGNVVQNFVIDKTVDTNRLPYRYFKLVVTEAEGTNPGLSYFQIFTLDQVKTSSFITD